MTMQAFWRGTRVVVTGTFTDNDGSGTQPTTATVTIHYVRKSDNTPTQDIITLTENLLTNPITWSGTWDSTPAAAGIADWFVSAAGPFVAVDGGSLRIEVNTATP